MMNCGNKINDLINKNYGSFDKEEKRKQKKLLKEQKKEEKRQEKLNQIQKLSFKEYLYNIHNLLFVALGFIACMLFMLYFVICSGFSRIENLIDNQIVNKETQAYTTEFKNINEYEYKETKNTITPFTVTNLTNTSWLFNDYSIPTPTPMGTYFNIDFVSNNSNFNSMSYITTPGGDELRYNSTVVYVYDESTFPPIDNWNNQAYRTINITGGSDVTNSTLIYWLNTNAIQLSTTTQLTTPILQFRFINNNNYLSWLPISNATTYAVYKDNVLITNTSSSFTNDGTYINYLINSTGTYYIVAIGDNTNYTDSNNSNSVTLPNTPLATPTIILSGDTISWSAVTGATGYSVYIDNSFLTIISTTSFTTDSAGTYKVAAISSNLYYYTTSSFSNSVTVYTLPTPTLSLTFDTTNGFYLSWTFATLDHLTFNFEIYKDNVLLVTTHNNTYFPIQNGVYKVRQLSNLSSPIDSKFSNSVTLSNLTHITYTLDDNITATTYFSSLNFFTNSTDFYFPLDSNNLPYTLFKIDNSNSDTGYVFKSVDDFSTTSDVEFNTIISNNQSILVSYSSINGDISASVVDYSATKIAGKTFYFYNETFTDNLVIGDYLLVNRPFYSNTRYFNNIFVNNYNYIVYDNNGVQENLVYFLSNLTGQYMNNSTYNYYLISFSAVDSNNTYFIQDYIADDDIFFVYYRIATQSDLDNISALNDQLIYINENYTFMSLFGAIIDAHFNTLKSLLNFQFFGINLWSIFTLLLTVSLVYMALKFLRGGKKE